MPTDPIYRVQGRLLLTVLLIGLTLPIGSAAQSADAFYHMGAQAFVHGERAEAAEAVKEGLRLAPENPRLLALREQLQQPPPQGGGTGGGERRDEQEQKKNANRNRAGSNPQDQERGDSSDPAGPRGETPPRQPPEQQNQPPERSAGEAGGEGLERPDQLTRTEAKRMLEALRYNEMRLMKERQNKATTPPPSGKDW